MDLNNSKNKNLRLKKTPRRSSINLFYKKTFNLFLISTCYFFVFYDKKLMGEDISSFQVTKEILNYLWRKYYHAGRSIIVVENESNLSRRRTIRRTKENNYCEC